LPLRNVLVELCTAVVFGFLAARYGLTGHMLLLSLYLSILILITVIDLEHRLVLNRVIVPAILLALIAGPFTPGLNWRTVLVGGLVGFGLFYLAAVLYPGGMGAGDVKLAAFIGLITGFPVIVLALLVTILAGGVISLLLIVTRLRSRRDFIPYGPFLVIGGVFALLWGRPIVDDYLDQYREERVSHLAPAPASTMLSLARPSLDPHQDRARLPRSALLSETTRPARPPLPQPRLDWSRASVHPVGQRPLPSRCSPAPRWPPA
jgi:leader peptidase (prepilin peptidase)/N-methyltransferase